MVYNVIEESRELGITIKPRKEEIKKIQRRQVYRSID